MHHLTSKSPVRAYFVLYIHKKKCKKEKKNTTNTCLKGLTVTPADRWSDCEEEQMSVNRWMHGLLPCTIYSGGSVSVCCQKLGLPQHYYTHAHTPNQPQWTVLGVLHGSQWDFIFMAALKSRKAGTSQVSSPLLLLLLSQEKTSSCRLE